MEEAVFYGLFFAVILFNYIVKMGIEKRGGVVRRSNLREGAVFGISIYLLHQTLIHPGISVQTKVVNTALGVACIVAGAVFFIKGRSGNRPESGD